MKRLEDKKEGDIVEVFKWFRSHVIDYKLEPSIEHQELVSNWNISLLGNLFTFGHVYYFFNLSKYAVCSQVYIFLLMLYL